MNIKNTLIVVFFSAASVCNAGENVMPLTQNNVAKLEKIKKDVRKNTAPSPGEDYDIVQSKITKDAIESMGYDSDKTIRASILFHDEIGFMGLDPLYRYVCFNPQKALSQNLISDKTFEVLNKQLQAEKENYNIGGNKTDEFLSLVENCMKTSKNGFCTMSVIADIWKPSSGRACDEWCSGELDIDFKVSKMQWLFLDKNNKPIKYIERFLEKKDAQFKINQDLVVKMKDFQSFKNEQQAVLFPK
jgi:hypothetical protein